MASDREFSHLRPAFSAPRWLFYRGLNICVLSLQSIYRQIGHMLDIIINIFIFICASLRVSRCMCCCLFRTATPSPSLSLSLTLSPLLHPPPPPHHTNRFAFVVTVSLTWRHARGLVAQQPANKTATTRNSKKNIKKINQRSNVPPNVLFVRCSLHLALFALCEKCSLKYILMKESTNALSWKRWSLHLE